MHARNRPPPPSFSLVPIASLLGETRAAITVRWADLVWTRDMHFFFNESMLDWIYYDFLRSVLLVGGWQENIRYTGERGQMSTVTPAIKEANYFLSK